MTKPMCFLLLWGCGLMGCIGNLWAQDTSMPHRRDSFFLAHKPGLLGRLGHALNVEAPSNDKELKQAKRVLASYEAHKSAVIRHIILNYVPLGGSMTDTSRHLVNFFTHVGQHLHVATKQRIIRNNLFFNEGDSLIPNLLAENERYLRQLNYIQDAHILIKQVVHSYDDYEEQDSVDVVVRYKEVFPINTNINADNIHRAYAEVRDDNFMGLGDRLVLQHFYDLNRHPPAGFGIEYSKRNINGSFVNLTLGVQNLNYALVGNAREELAHYARLELPLVSKYARWLGSMEFSMHENKNYYRTDSLFKSDFQYKYDVFDSWVGYNVTGRKNMHQKVGSKTFEFINGRVIRRLFVKTPFIYSKIYYPLVADQISYLTSVNVFKEEFYKTTFIYGFGRNEDIPVGYGVALIGGWTNKDANERPYLGLDVGRHFFTKKNSYYNYLFRLGSYMQHGELQDMSVLASLESFTRLRHLGNSRWYFRHFFGGSFAQQVNTHLDQRLVLNSVFGMPLQNNPDTTASSRITINFESVLYNLYRFAGFRFAPFAAGSYTYLKPPGNDFRKGDMYESYSLGLRTRNENLILGTIELKITYLPRTAGITSPWNITLNSDIKFKYNTELIKKPDFIVVN